MLLTNTFVSLAALASFAAALPGGDWSGHWSSEEETPSYTHYSEEEPSYTHYSEETPSYTHYSEENPSYTHYSEETPSYTYPVETYCSSGRANIS